MTRASWLRVGACVRIKHVPGVRRVVELDPTGARLVTVEGRLLPFEGGWYYASALEPAEASP